MAALIRKATVFENKMSDTTGSITTPEFNILPKTNFNARIRETTKSFASKSQGETALDLADKNREKIFPAFDLSYFSCKR